LSHNRKTLKILQSKFSLYFCDLVFLSRFPEHHSARISFRDAHSYHWANICSILVGRQVRCAIDSCVCFWIFRPLLVLFPCGHYHVVTAL